ncbi:MAG: GNAT family N-acetyltransferase [Methyloceanibacter sp.]
MAEIAVQRATLADAPLMAAIHAHSFDQPSNRPWDEAAMAQFVTSPGVICLIGAVTGKDAGGLLIARRAADEAELLTLGVMPACRRAGLGRALLTRAVDALHESGATQIFLEVAEGNAGALALYRSFGAAPVGRRPGYYEDGADATIFSLALSDRRSDDGPIADEPFENQR